MRGPRDLCRAVVPLLLAVALVLPAIGSGQGDEPTHVDPFGPPEGPIPFPIVNVSSSYDEDRFPSVYSDADSLRVIWNKGARDMFVYHVVQREFDGETWQRGEDWVSVMDPQDHDFVAHEHYSHEGMAVRYGGLVYFVFASDDQNYTTGSDHDIVLRTLDPATGMWGPIVEVTPDEGGQDREPQAAVLGGLLVIVWRTNDEGKADGTDDDLVLRTYDGAAFSAIVPVSPDDDDSMDARHDLAVTDDGRLCIVWEWNNRTNGPSDWDVLYREWNGTAFTSPPVPVTPDPARLTKLPRIAAMGNETLVVWESRPPAGEAGAVGIRGRVMDGTTPGRLLDVTRPGSIAENVQPDVVSAGDMAFILWSSFDDSLTHGPDSDIVMRSYDGETMGEVVEISHPRDGPEVNEGFVTACVFKDNLYAVWRMIYPVDPSIPLDVPVNEDIVLRRVTDLRVEVSPRLEVNPRVGTEIPIEVVVRTFYGKPVDPRPLGLGITVTRDLEVLPGKVEVTYEGEGRFEGVFVPEEKGSHAFIVTINGREMASTTVAVLGAGSGDGEDGSTDYYVYYTIGALALLGVAVIGALAKRR